MRHGTYSIVALDPATGELGVAVQSHWFSVGPLCAWARAGVGAVATQSVVEPAYGPNALDRLAEGVGRGERGAGGLPRVLDAINAQRVEILLVERGFSVPGFIGEDGLLYAATLPGATPCDDIVEKAIEKAIEQSAQVIGVRYHEDLGPLGKIGAVLRY